MCSGGRREGTFDFETNNLHKDFGVWSTTIGCRIRYVLSSRTRGSIWKLKEQRGGPGTSPPLRWWRPLIAQHNAEGPGKVVGDGAAGAPVHEGQEEGQEQQSQEEQP